MDLLNFLAAIPAGIGGALLGDAAARRLRRK